MRCGVGDVEGSWAFLGRAREGLLLSMQICEGYVESIRMEMLSVLWTCTFYIIRLRDCIYDIDSDWVTTVSSEVLFCFS